MYSKIKNSICQAYLKSNKINLKKTDISCSEITHDINSILFQSLKSYYFEDLFKDAEFVKSPSDEGDYYYIAGSPLNNRDTIHIDYYFKDKEELLLIIDKQKKNRIYHFNIDRIDDHIEKGYIRLSTLEYNKFVENKDVAYLKQVYDIFSEQYEYSNDSVLKFLPLDAPYSNKRYIESIKNNDRINKTLELLKKDKIFQLLFENDPLKKIINMKNKKDFSFSLIEIDNYNYEQESPDKILGNFVLFEDYHDLNSTLLNVYALNYYVKSSDKKYDLIVCHNNHEICGVSSLIDAKQYDSTIEENVAKYVSFIEVSKPYYGNKLGIKLMEEAIRIAEKNDLILFRTSSSPNGEKYIKEKIDQLSLTSNVNVVSEYERFAVNKLLSLSLKDKKTLNIEVKKLLKDIRSKYSENDLYNSEIQNKILKDINDSYPKRTTKLTQR